MNRAERRRMKKTNNNMSDRARKIRSLSSYIQQLQNEGVLKKPKPSLFKRIISVFKKAA